MTSGFSTAATWLQHISGQNPTQVIPSKKEIANDPVLRDLRAMKDTEIKAGVFDQPPPRKEVRGDKLHVQQQPKPKFVAHKDPTKGRKGKEKATSNRLGGEHMA
ncbi:hypothetical protein HJC23_011669 [Cyclotella cryptica]|uniref:Uncharacterized protein n=1 Tax=Cyclotella cryptica TaxID=29204 RepID=A0ABD3QJT4_9STRA|eukprot:CCRYP_004772-RA/>CCRYP_004772-RA protein AED:0.37 eAED:0.37 QI:0/-1/0/1/-1/1/1/0/103